MNAKKQKQESNELGIKELKKQVAALSAERDGLGVQVTQLKQREVQQRAAKQRMETHYKKLLAELTSTVEQQATVKRFRTGQAEVLLATVNHLEKALKAYADRDSWAASDRSQPDFRDVFIGTKDTMVSSEAGVSFEKIRTPGFEIAQEALGHELLSVG